MNLSIMLAAASPAQFRAMTERIRQAGFVVDREMPHVGIVTGSIEASKVRGLAAIDGVRVVEKEGVFSGFPDPDEPQ